MSVPTNPTREAASGKLQMSQSVTVIDKADVPLLPDTPPFSFETIDPAAGGNVSLPEFSEGQIFHQVSILGHPKLASRQLHDITDSALLLANAKAEREGGIPAFPDQEISMATHEQLLLQTAPRVFAHELMKKCAACGEPTEFAYVSSMVADYTTRPFIVDTWAPMCTEEGSCYDSLDAPTVDGRK